MLFESEEFNHVEDVDGFTDAKVHALLAHESQFETTMVITDDPDSETAAFHAREMDQMRVMASGTDFTVAEAFHRIDEL